MTQLLWLYGQLAATTCAKGLTYRTWDASVYLRDHLTGAQMWALSDLHGLLAN
jgi:hypothetical protein